MDIENVAPSPSYSEGTPIYCAKITEVQEISENGQKDRKEM